MSNLAINDAGDALMFDGKAWVPAPIATNDAGDRVAFDGAAWAPLPKVEKGALAKIGEAVNTGVNWLGTQFTKAGTAALMAPRAIADTNQAVVEWAGNKLGIPETGKAAGKVARYLNPNPVLADGPTNEDLNKVVFGSFGVPEVNAADAKALTLKPPMLGGGEINLGKMLDVGAQAVPMAIGMGPAAIPAAVGGAVGSEAAGQATAGTPYEIPARFAGAFVGTKGGQKITTPLPANLTPEQARLVEIAKDRGIPLTVGQETGRGRGVESALARFPTSAGQFARAEDRQSVALNKTALSEMNAPADIERLDPSSMRRAFSKASNEFEAAKNTSGDVVLPPKFFNDAGGKVGTYLENTAESAQVPSVLRRFNDFYDTKLVKPGAVSPSLSGEQYQDFRRGLNGAIEATSDSGARKALQGVRNALDDAMEASLPADQAEAWREVRKNWANLKILSKATSGGSIDTRAEGNLSPNALTGALRQRQGPDRFATTEGGLNDVARVSSYLADTRPNSGTPQTLQMQHLLTGGAPGALPGYLAGGPAGAAIGSAVSLASPWLLAKAMTGSKGAGWIRDYLANQSAAQLGVRNAPFTLAPGLMPLLEGRQ